MEKDDKKKASPQIDEEMMMSIMVDGIKKDGLQIPVEAIKEQAQEKPNSKERGRSKKTIEADYEKTFFKRSETTARNGKSVYISSDHHQRLCRIVQIIGEDNITIYAYLNNLLEYHFLEFAEQITTLYNEKYKPIL